MAWNYAKVTKPTDSSWYDQKRSTVSSPERSTTSTIKTQREIELEEELLAASSQLRESQQQLTKTNEQLKATQEANDNLKALLEDSVNNIKELLQVQRKEMEETLNQKLSEQWQHFQSHMALQNTNTLTTPNPPRKRQDTRHSPYETQGMILQQPPMQHPHYPMQHLGNQYQQYNMQYPQTYHYDMSPPPIYRPEVTYHYQGLHPPAMEEESDEILQESSQEDVSAAQP
jgi:hypothetical protein